MPLLATLDAAAFDALPDKTELGKDSYVKNEKENVYNLNMSGDEAAKLAIGLQQEKVKLAANNKDLLNEKVAAAKKLEPWEKLGKTPEEIEAILKEGKTPDAARLEEEHKAKLASIEREAARQVESAKNDAAQALEKSKAYLGQLQGEMKRVVVAELKTKFGMNDLADDWLSNRIQVVPETEDSDKFVVRVFENGQLAYKAGQPMLPAELVEDARTKPTLTGMFDGGTGGGSSADPQNRPPAAKGFVNANDPSALGANIEALAKGEIKAV